MAGLALLVVYTTAVWMPSRPLTKMPLPGE
jgi:hypothetical protein